MHCTADLVKSGAAVRLRMSGASYLKRTLCWRRKSPGALLKWRMRVGEMRAAASADSGCSDTCPDPIAASLPAWQKSFIPHSAVTAKAARAQARNVFP